MKKIVVTQRIDYIENYGEKRESIDQKLLEWLLLLPVVPIPISNKLVTIKTDPVNKEKEQPLLQKFLDTIAPDAVILSGGNNIGEYPERDCTENYLLNWAMKQRKPVLGICRGLQMMATWAGSKLVRIKKHVNTHHKIITNMEFGDFPDNVNSFHDWGLYETPKDFCAIAHCEDASIEAIKHNDLPWEGWMWHPERENPFLEEDNKRLKNLLLI